MAAPSYRGVVLIADDEEGLRQASQELLEGEGYLVVTASDGIDALARMRGMPDPRVAIIDLLMPGMNGWELIATMKADDELAGIPIIVLTSIRQVVHGADRHLRKPVTPEVLLETVQEMCR